MSANTITIQYDNDETVDPNVTFFETFVVAYITDDVKVFGSKEQIRALAQGILDGLENE